MQDTMPPTAEQLAMQRTVMASERTFMAWSRTSLSLISFGFTIYKFLEYAKQADGAVNISTEGVRRLGETLVGAGVLFLVLSSIQHWQHMRRVSSSSALKVRTWSLSMFLAAFLMVLGILALISMVFKIGPF